MTNKQWIRKAIPENHRGKLEKWAKGHNFMDINGDINLRKAMGFAKRHDEPFTVCSVRLESPTVTPLLDCTYSDISTIYRNGRNLWRLWRCKR